MKKIRLTITTIVEYEPIHYDYHSETDEECLEEDRAYVEQDVTEFLKFAAGKNAIKSVTATGELIETNKTEE